MAELTEEEKRELDLLDNEGQTNSANNDYLTDEEMKEAFDDPDLQRLVESGQFDPSTTTEAPEDVSVAGGQISVDVTPQMRAVAEQGLRDYDYYYGDKPRFPGPFNVVGGLIGDASDFFSGEENRQPSGAQERRDAAMQNREEFFATAQQTYESYPTASDVGLDNPALFGGEDVRVDPRIEVDEEGNFSTEYVRVPKPGTTAFTRMADQIGSDILQQYGGLLTEGKFLAESDLERSVPDFEQSGLEGLGTAIFSFGIPALAGERIGRSVGRTSRALRVAQPGSGVYNFSKIAGASIGASLAETVMSTEGDEGTVFTPDMLQETFKLDSPEQAASAAMFLDGLLLNGALDSILYVAGKSAGFISQRAEGTIGFFAPEFVRDKAQRQTLLGAVNIIDPELSNLPPNRLASSLKNLATVLDANASTLIEIGETSAEVSLDTANALSRGAEEYIRASRATKRRGMTDEEWNDYVRTEARDMVDRTIGLVRSQEGSAPLRTQQAAMSDSVDRAIMQEADRLVTTASEADDPLGEAAQRLVDQRNDDIASAAQARDSAAAESDRITANIDTAVERDPLVRQLTSSNDPLRFFNDDTQVEELRRILGEDLYQEFDAAWKEVDAAYKQIPNVGINTEKFVDDVNAVVQEANILDSSGARARQILGQIYRAVQPEASLDDAGEIVIEDPEELVARLDEQIGFQDLYRLRKTLSQMIGRTSDEGVGGRLKDLKDSITDGENGQLAYVRSAGDEAAAQAAEEADRLYRDTMSRFQSSEPLRRFSQLAEQRRRGDRTDTSERFLRRGEADISSGVVQDTLQASLSDPTGFQYEALRQAFDSPEKAARLTSATADLLIARGTKNLVEALRGNSSQSPEAIIRSFQEQARFLRQAGNPLYEELEAAAARIQRTQEDLGDELLAADELQRVASEQLRQAENTIVSRFVRRRRPGMATGQVQQEITSILGSKDAGDEIEALMDEVRRLPDGPRQATQQALQGSILRGLRSRLFGSEAVGMSSATETASGVRMGNLQAVTDEVRNSLLSAVRAAFPDSPDTVAGIEAALSGMNAQTSITRLRINQTGSPTAANTGVRDSVSTAILFSLGYMNPKAAAARRLTAEQVRRIEAAAKQTSEETVAMILAAPEQFGRLLRAISKKEDPGVVRELRDGFLGAAKNGLRYWSRTEYLPVVRDHFLGVIEESEQRASEQDQMEAFE